MTDAEADRIVPKIVILFTDYLGNFDDWLLQGNEDCEVMKLQWSVAIRQIIEEGLDRDN